MGKSETDFHRVEARGDEPVGGMKEEKDKKDISRECDVTSQVFEVLIPRKGSGIT